MHWSATTRIPAATGNYSGLADGDFLRAGSALVCRRRDAALARASLRNVADAPFPSRLELRRFSQPALCLVERCIDPARSLGRQSYVTRMKSHSANILSTSRLHLRGLCLEDALPIYNYRSLPEVARYQSWESFSQSDAEGLIADQENAKLAISGTWFQMAIVHSATQEVIGDCGLHCREDAVNQMELGITLSPHFQGEGYASEVLMAICGFVFEDLKMHRLMAVTDSENLAAIHLFLRNGFRQEAYFVDHVWFKGKWGSETVFVLLAREWTSRC